jgi:4-hydroxy-2-oxoheptanedioate aldolase
MSLHAPVFTNLNISPVLWGVSLYTGSTRLAEMAGKIGFDVVWIEMEHGPTGFQNAENICLAAEAGGAVPAIRVPSGQRHHVLRALEIGARIIVVPMVDTAEEAAEIVHHGKFPPLGMRGFNNRTRGTGYGLKSLSDELANVNSETHLFVQVETRRAVENIEDICSVQGLTGILVGPCDLSMSYGMNGLLDSPMLISTVVEVLQKARRVGRRTAIVVPPGAMLNAVMEVGCDLVICGGDVANLAATWIELLESVRSKVKR